MCTNYTHSSVFQICLKSEKCITDFREIYTQIDILPNHMSHKKHQGKHLFGVKKEGSRILCWKPVATISHNKAVLEQRVSPAFAMCLREPVGIRYVDQ